MAIVLLGTLDTKGHEYRWLHDRICELGAEVVVVDVGILGAPQFQADISREEVALVTGKSLLDLRSKSDRGFALQAMGEGASKLILDLHDSGTVSCILAAGGSGGSSVAAAVMQTLPVGVPKLLVSTMAGGDVRPYVGMTDLTLMNAVVDIAGINVISTEILGNAAAAAAGMAAAYEARTKDSSHDYSSRGTTVAATMFGVTTPAVEAARRRLEELGYEVLIFHATGSGGRTMEALVDDGFIVGVLDLTTTELADDLVGGVLSAGPGRLEAAARAGVPQVVSVGALDMVNFGPRETVPDRFRGRNLHVHNDAVTLMRTSAEEMEELGRRIGQKVSKSTGPAAVFIPLEGVSALDAEGAQFADPAADRACFAALKKALSERVELVESRCHINDEEFALAAADRLHGLIQQSSKEVSRTDNTRIPIGGASISRDRRRIS